MTDIDLFDLMTSYDANQYQLAIEVDYRVQTQLNIVDASKRNDTKRGNRSLHDEAIYIHLQST